jgi:pyruvate ferredoxin oxidoreductase beta subunit
MQRGKVTHTHIPPMQVPVEEYLRTQERFAHLFHLDRNEPMIAEIRGLVDAYWASVS